MKKRIKHYFKLLKENDKNGFSLVELIIVMAIMAILVGIVSSQVISYMEKSRQAKDQQQLSSLVTDIVSSIAQSPTDVADFSATKLTDCTGASWESELTQLRSKEWPTATTLVGIQEYISDKLTSKVAEAGSDIYVEYKNGTVFVWISGAGADYDSARANYAKLTVESE